MKSAKIIIILLLLGTAGALAANGIAADDVRHGPAFTETLEVMGKGPDYVIVGEQPLYVSPELTRIINDYGAHIDLRRLATPCLAQITYASGVRGMDKSPVILQLVVKRVLPGATAVISRDE